MPILVGKKKQRLIPGLPPEPVLPCRSHKSHGLGPESQVTALALTPGLPKPVFQALKLPGQSSTGGLPNPRWLLKPWLWEEVTELS